MICRGAVCSTKSDLKMSYNTLSLMLGWIHQDKVHTHMAVVFLIVEKGTRRKLVHFSMRLQGCDHSMTSVIKQHSMVDIHKRLLYVFM